MRDVTDLDKVKFVAKQLVMVEPHLTDLSPLAVQHPFTATGYVPIYDHQGKVSIVDITKGEKELHEWQSLLKKQIDEAKDLHNIYFMVNKPYTMAFLKFTKAHLSLTDYSELLADAWVRSENPNLDKNFTKSEMLKMFKDADPKILMDGEELKRLSELDDTVTVYRGVTSFNAKNIKALSWTLDQKTADWFAHRFDEQGTVYQAQIPKEHIYALFNGRGESEVIVDPKRLSGITEAPEMEEEIDIKM